MLDLIRKGENNQKSTKVVLQDLALFYKKDRISFINENFLVKKRVNWLPWQIILAFWKVQSVRSINYVRCTVQLWNHQNLLPRPPNYKLLNCIMKDKSIIFSLQWAQIISFSGVKDTAQNVKFKLSWPPYIRDWSWNWRMWEVEGGTFPSQPYNSLL